MTRWVLDIDKLATAVETVQRHRGVSARGAAAEIGVSPSTLTRLKKGQKPDADGLVSMLAWLHAEASQFTKSVEGPGERA